MKIRLLGLSLLAFASAAGAQQTVTQVRSSPATFPAGTTAPLQSDTHGSLHVVSDSTSVVTTTPAVTGNGTSATAQRVTLSSDSTGQVVANGNVASGATDSGNPVKVGCVYNSTTPSPSTGQRVDVQCSARSELLVKLMSNNSSMSDASGVFVEPKPQTSGGLSISRLVGATSGVIKGSAGQIYTCSLTSTNAATRYEQLYNKATAGTLSTDTPVVTITLPPSVPVTVNVTDLGAAFTTGISWQLTTDDVAIPTTAGSTTDIHGFCTYK